jgi:archaellum component FlaF (FlaF/FlaG flagellin family)
MAKDINLLPDVALKEEKQSKVQKLLTISSMAILIVGGVVVLGVYTIFLTTKADYDKVQRENETLKHNILTYAETEIIQRGISSKVTASSTIIKTAKDYKTVVENIQNLVPDGIVISDIQIDKTDKIALNAKANTSVSFNEYVVNLLDPLKGGKKFANITIGSVSGSKDGALQFNIVMNLLKSEEEK